MCNTSSNNPSFEERVKYYISKKEEIEVEYKNRMEALNKEASNDILANCPIKVGDVYVNEINNSVRLEKKDANNKIYGIIVGAKAVIKTDNEVHKLITVMPENVNTPFDFDLAEWSVSLRER